MRALLKKIVDYDGFFTIQDVASGTSTQYNKKFTVQCDIRRNSATEGTVKIIDENDPSAVIFEGHYEQISINGKRMISPLNCREVLKKVVSKKSASLHNHLISSNSGTEIIDVEKMRLKADKNQAAGNRAFTHKVVSKTDGTLGMVEDTPNVVFNFTDKFQSTITVNHVYPAKIPEKQAYAEEVQRVLEQYKDLDFTVIPKEGWEITTLNNLDNSKYQKFYEGGKMDISAGRDVFKDIPFVAQEFVTIKAKDSYLLSKDKNWILKIEGDNALDIYNGGTLFAGVSQKTNSVVIVGVNTSNYNGLIIAGTNNLTNLGDNSRERFLAIVIKIDDLITTILYGKGTSKFATQRANPELGDFYPQVSIRMQGSGFIGRMSIKKLN